MFEHDSKSRRGADDEAASSAKPHVGAVNAALAAQGGMPHGGARVHDDPTSHAAADALGARAFTAGANVFFGAGQYAPGTPQGDDLLRHELAHVDQARGVAAPQPGNFRVSDPHGAEEHAADAGGAATAQPQTIYRKKHTGHAPAEHGDGPAAHGHAKQADGHAKQADGPAKADPYLAWKQSVAAGDRGQATSQWDALSAHDRARTRGESATFLHKVVDVMKSDAVEVLRSAHADLDDVAPAILGSDEFDKFYPAMRKLGLFNRFIHAAPHRGHVSQGRAKKLGEWMQQVDEVHDARAIFNKVYPAVHDHANPALGNGVHAHAWKLSQIRYLYEILTTTLPVGHAQTISGGFVIYTPIEKPKVVDFGWYQSDIYRVTLPGHSGARGAELDRTKHGGHSMTGGINSGRVPIPEDPKDAEAEMGHYTVTALHEVGHGVGDRMGGNDYALDPKNYPGWTWIGEEEWGDALWEAPTGKGDPSVPAAARLEDNQARRMFLLEIKYGPGSYQRDGISHGDMVKWAASRYANVPLCKWWKYLVLEGNTKDGAFRFDDADARIRGKWAYSYLTRAGEPYMKMKANAYETRVSWYSVSSPWEWFAEQYAHFYRTGKKGGGLIDDDTKALLKKLDDKSFNPKAKGKGNGNDYGEHGEAGGPEAPKGRGKGGGGGGGGGGDRVESGGGAHTPERKHENIEPLFFPWSPP